MSEDPISEIAAELQEDVPKDAVTQRSGGGGMKLDYVTGRYVKQRLNEIFGWQGWSLEVVEKTLFPDECTCFAHVRLTVEIEGERVYRDGMAYGHGRKGPEGFDFAIAESVTDALKRAAVTLGENLGLSLYPYAKGSKAAPEVHEAMPEVHGTIEGDIDDVSDHDPKTGQYEDTGAKSLVEGFSRRLGEAINITELKQVWAQVQASPLSGYDKKLLESIKDMSKERVG